MYNALKKGWWVEKHSVLKSNNYYNYFILATSMCKLSNLFPFSSISVDILQHCNHPYLVADLCLNRFGKIRFPFFFCSGSQQHSGAEGCKRHILQPTVSSAVSLQLPQISAQNGAELPAPRLGDEDSPQRTTLFYWSQQQNNHLGERTLPPITQHKGSEKI